MNKIVTDQTSERSGLCLFLLQFLLKTLWTISGLSHVQLDKDEITILCHQYQSRPCTFALKLISMDKSRSSSTEIRILN